MTQTDIVERLRNPHPDDYLKGVMADAADEIERLRSECRQWQEEAGQMTVRAEELEDQSERFYDTIVRLGVELDAAKNAVVSRQNAT